jgi:hypothetical protein
MLPKKLKHPAIVLCKHVHMVTYSNVIGILDSAQKHSLYEIVVIAAHKEKGCKSKNNTSSKVQALFFLKYMCQVAAL